MQTKILTAYTAEHTVVAVGENIYYTYPHNLSYTAKEKLVAKVNEAGAIDDSKWIAEAGPRVNINDSIKIRRF